MYCGSKAAIRLMSETLALEMKPLGVKVVIVITGNIRTRWFVNSPRLELPEGSFYTSIVDRIDDLREGRAGPSADGVQGLCGESGG
jgi:NAD(P)-dependent dehydrogenase (short-subunit alcohol dehydrogenase family)